MQSQLFPKCPQCRKNGLLVERQGKYFCANCMYDYTQLKDDPDKLDEVLLENIQEAAFGPVVAITLYEWVTLKPHQEAIDHVTQLAEAHNIDIMPSTSKLDILKNPIILIFIVTIVFVLIILALLGYF